MSDAHYKVVFVKKLTKKRLESVSTSHCATHAPHECNTWHTVMSIRSFDVEEVSMTMEMRFVIESVLQRGERSFIFHNLVSFVFT
jgi:hypothetical protein